MPLIAGCSDPDSAECSQCGAPAGQGAIVQPKLVETSGLAASSTLPGVFYAHNDSGNSARFYAVSRTGEDLGIFDVDNAMNEDWEDMDSGPCPAGNCLYIGDIGDNERERLAYTLYRMVEPTVIQPGEQAISAERLVFTYPDGAHNAEVLLVHPITGEVTIVTKVGKGPAQVFALPLPLVTGKTLMARQVGEARPPKGANEFTGGSIHPEGTALLMRTNSSLYYYPMQPEQTAAEALAGEPCALPVADEKNGEAVAWLAGGAEIITLGEGEGAQIHVSSCTRD
ncbi:MAG: hypothetical protein H0T76_14805 [Nannocystis sp.]|nr:hypothetical protein [Nannocystis sp.]MBA3547751.1 hypothetical protein [Nannocystis sp.]